MFHSIQLKKKSINLKNLPFYSTFKKKSITNVFFSNPNFQKYSNHLPQNFQDHIFCLMKNDSYQRFLRSEIYRDLVNLSRKKVRKFLKSSNTPFYNYSSNSSSHWLREKERKLGTHTLFFSYKSLHKLFIFNFFFLP